MRNNTIILAGLNELGMNVYTLSDHREMVLLRDVYKVLKARTEYHVWVKRDNMTGYFIEGDIIKVGQSLPESDAGQTLPESKLAQKVSKRGGHNRVDHLCTLEAAKHVAMMENTGHGRLIRQYFINLDRVATPEQRKLALDSALAARDQSWIGMISGETSKEEIHERMTALYQSYANNYKPYYGVEEMRQLTERPVDAGMLRYLEREGVTYVSPQQQPGIRQGNAEVEYSLTMWKKVGLDLVQIRIDEDVDQNYMVALGSYDLYSNR